MSATITPVVTGADDVVEPRIRDKIDERWSARRTIAFVVVVCGGFWLAVGALAASLLQAL